MNTNHAKENQRGITLIESVVAYSILVIIITSILVLFQSGIEKIGNSRLKRQSQSCAILLMEYLLTLPGDLVFAGSPGSPANGTFDSGPGFMDIDSIVKTSGTGSECRNLSLDTGVNLRYTICPACEYSCVSTCQGWGCGCCAGSGESVKCAYTFKLRVEWDSPGGRPGKVDFQTIKFVGGELSNCVNAGCGGSACMGDIACNLP